MKKKVKLGHEESCRDGIWKQEYSLRESYHKHYNAHTRHRSRSKTVFQYNGLSDNVNFFTKFIFNSVTLPPVDWKVTLNALDGENYDESKGSVFFSVEVTDQIKPEMGTGITETRTLKYWVSSSKVLCVS